MCKKGSIHVARRELTGLPAQLQIRQHCRLRNYPASNVGMYSSGQLAGLAEWVGAISSCRSQHVTDALFRGTGGIIWGTIAVWFFMIGLIASIAEMASMAPNSGGQYHWVSGTSSHCYKSMSRC